MPRLKYMFLDFTFDTYYTELKAYSLLNSILNKMLSMDLRKDISLRQYGTRTSAQLHITISFTEEVMDLLHSHFHKVFTPEELAFYGDGSASIRISDPIAGLRLIASENYKFLHACQKNLDLAPIKFDFMDRSTIQVLSDEENYKLYGDPESCCYSPTLYKINKQRTEDAKDD